MPYNQLGDLQTLVLGDNVSCENPCVILTMDDILCFMGDLTVSSYSAGDVLASLSEDMSPAYDVVFPCYLDNSLVRVTVQSIGSIVMDATAGGVLHMNGICVNICDRYYNSEIGNNYPQGTSALGGTPYEPVPDDEEGEA